MRFNFMLRALSAPFRLYPPGEAPVRSPEGFRSYAGVDEVPAGVLRDTAMAYARVFSEPPWNEAWEPEAVMEKMRRELRPPSCLTLMRGNEHQPVGGFAWGAVVPVEEAAERTLAAHGFRSPGVKELLDGGMRGRISGRRVFFLDEVAILREFRGGMAPIQFLVRPALEMAVWSGATEGVGWTSWSSKIAPLSLYLGFSEVVAEVEGIAFLYNPDIRPLLKIAQNVNGQALERLVRSASRLVRRAA
ncbi:MAG: hypothetical protein QME88_02345 [Actinomycetota bacterium]|nr:hypothetical protein [Actinomycetota bacterium]